MTQKNGWSTDYATVANEVDYYNAMICKQMGWGQYIYSNEGVADPPKSTGPGLAPRLRAAAAGAQLHADWYADGYRTVPKEQAEARATVCATCPQNKRASLLDFFTVKGAAYIERQIEKKREMKLETNRDSELGVCQACTCPLGLKVWTPLDIILKHLLPEQKAALDPRCWILAEAK